MGRTGIRTGPDIVRIDFPPLSSTEKKVLGSSKLQAEKLQSSLHQNSEDLAAGPPQPPVPPPRRNPAARAVVRRGRLSRSTKAKANATTHDFQRTDSVNLEKLLPLPVPEEALDRCFQMLSSDDW